MPPRTKPDRTDIMDRRVKLTSDQIRCILAAHQRGVPTMHLAILTRTDRKTIQRLLRSEREKS